MQQACQDACKMAQKGCPGRQQLDVQQLGPADILHRDTILIWRPRLCIGRPAKTSVLAVGVLTEV